MEINQYFIHDHVQTGDSDSLATRAGLRHVRGVRPNRAADFRGRHFGPPKFRIN